MSRSNIKRVVDRALHYSQNYEYLVQCLRTHGLELRPIASELLLVDYDRVIEIHSGNQHADLNKVKTQRCRFGRDCMCMDELRHRCPNCYYD